jgi:peptide-methionine (S)-S-oxide reductase
MFMHNSGASCRENAETHSIVVARLDRAIQYFSAREMELKSCGVLDTRLRGYDGGVWSALRPHSQSSSPTGDPVAGTFSDGNERLRHIGYPLCDAGMMHPGKTIAGADGSAKRQSLRGSLPRHIYGRLPSGRSATASLGRHSFFAANYGEIPMTTNTERAVLAGGCFWGMQDLIRRKPGVVSTRVGYSGGEVKNATYRNHGNHAEAIEIVFDPRVISFRDLLEFFFQIHDPTTRDRQGNDIGASYRSAIFYTSPEQEQVARDTIADVEASGLWPGKVVTEVSPVGDFWQAEPEHQDYLERYPTGYTCHFVRPGWKLPRRVAV